MNQYENEKQSVLTASLWLSDQGYFGSHRGSGGNVSVRLSDTAMAITPSSVRYQELSVDDICVVGFDSSAIEVKKGLKPSVESGLHGIVYQNRPDVNAVVHTHQIYGSVFGVINTPIPSLFDEVSFSLGQVIERLFPMPYPEARNWQPMWAENYPIMPTPISFRIMGFWRWVKTWIKPFSTRSFWRKSHIYIV